MQQQATLAYMYQPVTLYATVYWMEKRDLQNINLLLTNVLQIGKY